MSEEIQLRPLRVTRKEVIARDVYLFELRDPSGANLPSFDAGSHIALRVPGGAMRQYSLCNDPSDTDRYQIAVKREAMGRGGSIALVDKVMVADTVMVATPSNMLPIDAKAKNFILIAGGIGITPMIAIMRSLIAEGLRNVKLYYFTRDAEGTAFLEELAKAPFAKFTTIIHSQGAAASKFDLWSILERPVSGTHLYCCGPKRLMDGVKDMTGHWPTSSIHFESFGADTKPHADDTPFDVVLKRSGQKIAVGSSQSILEALRNANVHVPSSCESGTCGSCKVTYTDGQVSHRDLALLDEEKSNQIIVCVSRATSSELVLDL